MRTSSLFYVYYLPLLLDRNYVQCGIVPCHTHCATHTFDFSEGIFIFQHNCIFQWEIASAASKSGKRCHWKFVRRQKTKPNKKTRSLQNESINLTERNYLISRYGNLNWRLVKAQSQAQACTQHSVHKWKKKRNIFWNANEMERKKSSVIAVSSTRK